MLFESAAERDNTVRNVGAVDGLNQTLGRLAEHLAKM
jgi:ribosomal protein L13